jgi:hypothetical protein
MPEVTADPAQAARWVASGTPVVLVGTDPVELGRFMSSVACSSSSERAGPQEARSCLVAVLVGDLANPDVARAAAEMAAEMWPWQPGPKPLAPLSLRGNGGPQRPTAPSGQRPLVTNGH